MRKGCRIAVLLVVLALRLAGRDADTPVQLPPLLVEGHSLQRPRWRHAEVAGYEILSACPDPVSGRFVDQVRRRRWELTQLVPEDFLFHGYLPMTLILVPPSFAASMQEGMAAELRHADPSLGGNRLVPHPHLRLEDLDGTDMYVVLQDFSGGGLFERAWAGDPQRAAGVVLAPDYFRYLLEARVPALPEWFVAGVLGLYADDRFVDSEMSFDPQRWLSDAVTAKLRDDPEAFRPMLPLGELFVARLDPGAPEAYRRVWAAQAELFVRWAVSGGIPDGRARLWRFAAAATHGAVTEELFHDCFGMDYADARDAVSDFLGEAVLQPVHWRESPMPSLPALDFGDAAPADVRRIQGEWTRRVLRLVQARFPRLLPVYEQHAQALLQGGYDRGERDSRLVSSLGLFRAQLGDEPAARALLEQAAAAGGTRPLALLTLAQLRFTAALRTPRGPKGALSDAQAQEILALVETALREGPPLRQAYMLLAEVGAHCAGKPTVVQAVRLKEGREWFGLKNPLDPHGEP